MAEDVTDAVATWLKATLDWQQPEFVTALSGATPISRGSSAMVIVLAL